MTENTENNPPIEDTKEKPELSLSPDSKDKTKKIINEDYKKQKIVNSKYLLDKLNKEKLNKLKEEQEKEIKQQCTFKPAINTNYKLKDWKTEAQPEESKEGNSNNSSSITITISSTNCMSSSTCNSSLTKNYTSRINR